MTERMPRRPSHLLIAAAAAAATLLAGCGGSSSGGTATSKGTAANSTAGGKPAPTNGVLSVGLLGDIGQPPDPDIYYANNGTAIMINAYEGLVQYKNNDDKVEIAPRLATAWTVSPDNKVFTFTLRHGVTFHDGTPFTSAAIKVAFDRRIAVKGGAAYMVTGVASVDSSDPYKAVITLKDANSAFLDELASPFGPKMESPTGLTKQAGKDNAQTYLMTHDLGTGPYELTAAQSGSKYVLTQYSGYWGSKSPYTTVNLPVYNDASALELAFDHGDIGAIVAALPSSSLKRYTSSTSVNNYFLPTLQSAIVTTNPSKSFFKTQQARLAFLQAINREQIIPEVLGARSTLATTLYASGAVPGGADKQTISYNPGVMAAYAKTLPPNTPMTIGYANGNPNAQQIANLVAAAMQADGVKASAQGYDTSTVFGWEMDPTKGPDTFVDGNNGPDGGSPYLWGHVFWDKSGGIDYFNCDYPQVDSMLDSAVKTGDNATFVAAAELYAQSGCYLNFSYNRDWVVAQKYVTNVAQAQNIGANELDFSKLGLAP